jgi:hypothetical protein
MIPAEEHQRLIRVGPNTPTDDGVRCYCRPL